MSLEDIRSAAEKDQQTVVEKENLLDESVWVSGKETGPESNQQLSGENHALAARAAGEGSLQHGNNNIVYMHGNLLSIAVTRLMSDQWVSNAKV